MNTNSVSDRAMDLGIPTKIHERDPATLAPKLGRILGCHFPERTRLAVSHVDVPSGAGVNNETLLLDLAWREGRRRMIGGAVLRIDTPNNLFFAPSFAHHYRLYEVMADQPGVPVPQVYGFETDTEAIGRPFFFMERIEGRVPSDQPPFHSAGWMAEASPAARKRMWQDAVKVLAQIHATDIGRVGFLDRPELARSGLEQEFVHALDYCEDALGGDRHPVVEAGRDWLRRHFPGNPGTAFAWGDARPQNLMFRDDRVVALFDWDMASLAGPEADLAWWSLMDLSNTVARGLPRLDGWGSPAETIALWKRLTGKSLRDMDWHFAFAAFRGAVIVMRLAKMLERKGQLPPGSADWKDNSIGVQYLASMLGLVPMGKDNAGWPGVAV